MPDGLTGRRRMLLTTDAVGGVWRYTMDLAHGLRDRGVEPVIAVLGPAATAGQVDEADGIRLVQTGLPLDWTADSSAALARAADRLASLAALLGVASVHLHAPALLGSARWPAPVVVVGHSCVGTWWRAMRDGSPPLDFTWRIDAARAGFRGAAAVIAPSAAHAEAIRAVYGPLPIEVIHNAAAPVTLPSRPRDRAILTAGRLWDEAKGAADIDIAAATMDCDVRAAGPVDGPNGARVDLPHLRLLGTLDAAAMQAAYASATVFVSAARYEPFGLSILEAAQAGMRLVLSDIPTFRELWDGAALFTTQATLAATLRTALDTPNSDAAQTRAATYTLDATTHRTLAIHDALKPSPIGSGLGEGRAIRPNLAPANP